MLDNLRKKQKGIIWAIAIIFVLGMAGLSVFEIFAPKPFVGKIYGNKISLERFDELFRINAQQFLMQSQDATFDEQTQKQLNDQTWNMLVNETVMDKQFKRYRIRVRDRDVVNIALNDPPEAVRTIPDFQTNGEFDFHKYLTMLNDNDFFAYQLEEYLRQTLPRERLERKIKDQVVVTPDSVRNDWLERNDRITARVIYFDWNRVPAQEVSEEEIQAYYNQNRNDYRVEASRRYLVLQLPLEASEDDTVRVQEDIRYIESLLLGGADFGDLAEFYSQDPGSAANRGSLGFFGRGRMVPEFENYAFTLNVGEMSPPFQSQFGWHILLVTDKRENEQGQPEVEASHILLNIEPSERTRFDLRNLADDVHDRAARVGLAQAAEEMGLTTRETSDFHENADFIPGLGRYPKLVSDAFSRRVGFLAEPIEEANGSIIIAELSNRQNAHIQDIELVTEAIRRELDREKRTAIANERAAELLSNFEEDEYFEQAEEMGFRILDINNRLITQTITGLGMDRALKDALFSYESEEWTSIITTERGSFIAFVSERAHPDMEDFENNIDTLTAEYTQRKEQEHYSQWYQKALEEAKVEDLRFMYYNFN